MITIIHERDLCTGCHACVDIDRKHWRMDPDAKATLLHKHTPCSEVAIEEGDFDTACECAYSCPVNCIHVVKDGKKIV